MPKRLKIVRIRTVFILSTPALLFILGLSLLPIMGGVFFSFSNYNLFRPADRHWIGYDNYASIIFFDAEYHRALINSFSYTGLVVALSYAIGMLFAILLNQDIKFKAIFRALALVPWVLPPAVAGVNWAWVLHDQFGYLNMLLKRIGLITKSISFLGTPQLARITVVLAGSWKCYPFMMILILAGMQAIPKELYEVADIDGAGFIKRFFWITLPMLRPVSFLGILVMFIWSFNNFENIYLLTRGGSC